MGEVVEMNAERVVERIRDKVRQRRKEAFAPLPSDQQIATDLATLRTTEDVYDVEFPTPRRFLGPALGAAKRALRRLLAPVLAKQITHNAAGARVARHLKEQIEALAQRQEDLREILAAQAFELQTAIALQERMRAEERAALAKEVESFGLQDQHRARELQSLRNAVASLESPLRVLRERLAKAERRVRRLRYAPGVLPSDAEGGDGGAQLEDVEFDYAGLEERFRGSEEEIRERQRLYLEVLGGRGPVLDVGCGRGEFLELMRDAGTEASGVDIHLDMVLECREKGLTVVQRSAFDHLMELPDESLGAVFSAQVVEHLEPTRMIRLVQLCHRKLKPDGSLVLETINPQCPSGMNAFYLDPSHVKPVHPEMLRFALESAGFREVEVRYISYQTGAAHWSTGDEGRARTDCPDYAAIARK